MPPGSKGIIFCIFGFGTNRGRLWYHKLKLMNITTTCLTTTKFPSVDYSKLILALCSADFAVWFHNNLSNFTSDCFFMTLFSPVFSTDPLFFQTWKKILILNSNASPTVNGQEFTICNDILSQIGPTQSISFSIDSDDANYGQVSFSIYQIIPKLELDAKTHTNMPKSIDSFQENVF